MEFERNKEAAVGFDNFENSLLNPFQWPASQQFLLIKQQLCLYAETKAKDINATNDNASPIMRDFVFL